jgi:hypothetical protein
LCFFLWEYYVVCGVFPIVEDVKTVANPNASTVDRVISGASLATEVLPVGVGDIRDIYRTVRDIAGKKRAVAASERAAKKAFKDVEPENPVFTDNEYHHDKVKDRREGNDARKLKEARKEASDEGREMVDQLKAAGKGGQAGKSGGSGTPHNQAGAELIRRGNLPPDPKDPMGKQVREAQKIEGNRLIKEGDGYSHK